MILVHVLATIGGYVVLSTLWALLEEIIRTARQSRRIATAIARMNGRRKPSARLWWHRAKVEFFSSYSWTAIGPWRFNHSPRIPVRKDW